MKALRANAPLTAGLATFIFVAAGAASAGMAVLDLNVLKPVDLVKTLVGCGVTVGDFRYVGDTSAAGVFMGGTGIIGGTIFDQGIILSSGKASSIIGPNKSDGTSDSFTPDRSDPDLSGLALQDTHDASVLEFEFTPSSTYVTFDYVFGSEEYNEWVFAFNDVFAFFLNGANVALVPGTTTPVSINTVNGGNPYGIGAVNPFYFVNNDLDDGGPSYNTEMDGFTTMLTVNAPVKANQRNWIKLAIADGGDQALNSWVLIRAGSFASRCPGSSLSSLTQQSLSPGVIVAPNPFRPGSGGAQDAAAVGFSGLSAGATIRIYTPAGKLVAEETDNNADGMISWNGRNRGGKAVASGAYIWVAKARDGAVTRGKLVVIR